MAILADTFSNVTDTRVYKVVWFISDTHLWHKNIIRLSNRPFAHLHEMHEYIIQEWNKRVRKPTDKIYVLGDFTFANGTMTKPIVDRLNGYKIFIKGNHDRHAKHLLAMGFHEVHENIFIEIGNKQKVFLSHFPYHPMVSYQKPVILTDDQYPEPIIKYPEHWKRVDMRYMHKRIVDDGKSWLLHGHVHNAWVQNGRQINVGVDVNEFKPVSHHKILQMIAAGPKFEGKNDNDYGD